MNGALARLLTRLYPRAWRERYGAEFAAFLEGEQGGARALANVIWSALGERMVPTRGSEMDQSSRSFRFHSWCLRAPWAVFGLSPLLFLAGAYLIACLYLWSVWMIFLPGADTPFGVRSPGPPYGFENLLFQFGKFYYFGAPILVGWGIGLVAARQRIKVLWPTVGLVLTAVMGGTARIQASRNGVPTGLGHIRMDLFAFGPSIEGIYDGMFHALLILLFTMLPYLIWRLQKVLPLSH